MGGLPHVIFGGWYPAGYAALKAVALFIVAAAAFRLTQRRTIAEFSPFDWVVAVAVGGIIARTATAANLSMVTGAAALLALIIAHNLVARLRFVAWIRRLVDPPVRQLVRDGEIDDVNLRRCGLTRADLDAILRLHGYADPGDVGLALYEAKGAVSVFPRSANAIPQRIDHPRRR